MSDDFDKLRAVFDEAVERVPPEGWDAFLDHACAGQDVLRREVARLLKAHAEETVPAADGAAGRPSAIVSKYKLLEVIGEGGMGTVWMAQQTEPVRRKVAVKLIKSGMDSRQVVARFEAERQALALMDHPNIARVLDGGTTEAGLPYFVMELVKGVPITKYCDEHRLTPRQRLELFLPVCQAVQHAHQKGVIHRDLKPSNVLVALYDGRPVPKVIDFGVAKAAGAELTDKTLFTGFGAVIGTLEYMSPEQAELNNLDVDTRSDVYSLGVLLYELLTGTTPLERKRLKATSLMEALRLIREEEPPAPSTRLGTAKELPALAASRGVEGRQLTGQVRGEVDWIVMRCLEKDRSRRYETVNALTKDIVRHLADEPVLACPPSSAYRLRKFVRRHRAALAVAAVVMVILVLGAAVSTWQALRATAALGLADERLLAEEEARREADQQREQARRRLYDARLAQARANRWSRQVGQREEGLQALREAVGLARELGLGEESLAELRDEMIACLALADARPVQPAWTGFPAGSTGMPGFDADLGRYARSDEKGAISIRGVADDQEIARLPGRGPGGGRSGAAVISFSPDGRLLAVSHWNQIPGSPTNFQLWDWRAGQVVFEPAFQLKAGAHEYTPDGRHVALAREDGTVTLHECAGGKEVRRWNAGLKPWALAFHPGGGQLAITEYGGRKVQTYDLATGRPLHRFEARAKLVGAAWHPDGGSLAAVAEDAKVYRWEVAGGRRAPGLPGGHLGAAYFAAGGRLLVSHLWDGTSRVWDPWTGHELFALPGYIEAVSRDGRRAVTQEDTRLRHWELLPSQALRTLPRAKAEADDLIANPAFSPDGRWLLGSGKRGVWVWDLAWEGPAALLPLPGTGDARFHPRREEVFTSGVTGLFVWQARVRPGVFQIGPAARRLPLGPRYRISLDREGSHLTVVNSGVGSGAVVFDPGDPHSRPLALPHVNAIFTATSPDGRWVATGTQHGYGVKLWDARTGKEHRHLLPEERWATATFSPDSRRLVTGTPTTVAVWDVATGGLVREIRRDQQGDLAAVAFSPDGRLLAATLRLAEVQLIDPATWRTVARLLGPDATPIESGTIAFSPDGGQLVVATKAGDLRLWDLRWLRGRLGEFGLDWGHPAYPPPRHAGAAPCEVRADLAEFQRLARFLEHLKSGRAHANAKRYREALAEYDKAVALAPEEASGWHGRGQAHLELGEYDAAFRDIARAAELAPANSLYVNNLAWQLATCPREDLRDTRRALALAQRAVLLGPRSAESWNTLGAAYYRAGRWADAVGSLRESLRRQGGNGWDWFFLAMAHWQLGEKDTARRYHEKAVAWTDKHRPKDEELRRLRAEAEALLGAGRAAGGGKDR